MRRSLAISATIAIAAASVVRGQTPTVATRTEIISEMVRAGVSAAERGVPGNRPVQTTFGTGGEDEIAAYLIAVHSEREGYQALVNAVEARVDKQVGSAPTNSGSTSLAMKGLVPDILGIAVDNGALDREVKGTTLTFRASLAGIVKALQGRGVLDIYADYSVSPAARFAARFSAAASFDTSRGPAAGTFTGDDQQPDHVVGTLRSRQREESGSAAVRRAVEGLARDSKAYRNAANAINAALGGWSEFKRWEG